MRAVIVTGKYNSISLGQILEVESLSRTAVFFKGNPRGYMPKVCVFVDDAGNTLNRTEAITIFKKERE